MKLPLAAIVPVYNPEPGLAALVAELAAHFAAVVVVDDGSVEATEAFAALPSTVTLLRHAVNRGKGRAMKTALEWVSENAPHVDGVVFADGDGQHGAGDEAVAADAEGPGAHGFLKIQLFHSLHLRFSKDCTLRKRKIAMTVRK